MTGAYLRVLRDNEWENIEVEHLTDKERSEAMQGRDQKELLRWLHLVCNRLSYVENEYFTSKEKDQ